MSNSKEAQQTSKTFHFGDIICVICGDIPDDLFDDLRDILETPSKGKCRFSKKPYTFGGNPGDVCQIEISGNIPSSILLNCMRLKFQTLEPSVSLRNEAVDSPAPAASPFHEEKPAGAQKLETPAPLKKGPVASPAPAASPPKKVKPVRVKKPEGVKGSSDSSPILSEKSESGDGPPAPAASPEKKNIASVNSIWSSVVANGSSPCEKPVNNKRKERVANEIDESCTIRVKFEALKQLRGYYKKFFENCYVVKVVNIKAIGCNIVSKYALVDNQGEFEKWLPKYDSNVVRSPLNKSNQRSVIKTWNCNCIPVGDRSKDMFMSLSGDENTTFFCNGADIRKVEYDTLKIKNIVGERFVPNKLSFMLIVNPYMGERGCIQSEVGAIPIGTQTTALFDLVNKMPNDGETMSLAYFSFDKNGLTNIFTKGKLMTREGGPFYAHFFYCLGLILMGFVPTKNLLPKGFSAYDIPEDFLETIFNGIDDCFENVSMEEAKKSMPIRGEIFYQENIIFEKKKPAFEKKPVFEKKAAAKANSKAASIDGEAPVFEKRKGNLSKNTRKVAAHADAVEKLAFEKEEEESRVNPKVAPDIQENSESVPYSGKDYFAGEKEKNPARWGDAESL
jgi:hypothetical protein